MTTPAPSPAAAHHVMSPRTRVVLSILLIVLPIAPSLLLAIVHLQAGAGTFVLSAFAVLLGTVMASPRVGVRIGVLLALASAVAILVAPNPWGSAVLMAAIAAVYGYSARVGISSAILMAPIALGFLLAMPAQVVAPADGIANAAIIGGVALAGGAWGLVLGWALGRRAPHAAPTPIDRRDALFFAAVLAVVAGIAQGVVTQFDLAHGGAWLLLTIFLLIQPSFQESWTRSLHRILGTALGFVIALVIGLLVQGSLWGYLLGMLFLGAAIYVKLDSRRPYWQFVTLLTPGIVLAESSSSDIVRTDLTRLWFTLVGATVTIVVLVVLHPVFARMHRSASPASGSGQSPAVEGNSPAS